MRRDDDATMRDEETRRRCDETDSPARPRVRELSRVLPGQTDGRLDDRETDTGTDIRVFGCSVFSSSPRESTKTTKKNDEKETEREERGRPARPPRVDDPDG